MDSSHTSSKRRKKRPNYEPPAIFPPRLEHKHSVIILHGRHNNGKNFGQGMLNCQIPELGTLQQALPHAKFIFPSATKRKGILFGNSLLIQWFDNWFLEDPPEREDLVVEGLQDTTEYVHELLRKEVAEVGASNVALGGISQGCVATLASLLLWDGEPLGAAIGIAGWLPFSVSMMEITKDDPAHQHGPNNQEVSSGDQAQQHDRFPTGSEKAVAFFYKQMGISTSSLGMAFQHTPFFLGHGQEDDKVFFFLGQRATACLQDLGANAQFFGYPGLGHWYSKEMLADIVRFLRSNTDWDTGAAT